MTTSSSPKAGWIVGILSLIVLGGTGWVISHAISSNENEKATTPPASSQAPVYAPTSPPVKVVPAVEYKTTPAETEMEGFNIEITGPSSLMIQYPGEKPFLFTPSSKGNCDQLPQPRIYGPTKFWDPKDPENGHVDFRIYKVSGPCKK
jgi:hypothetical protein